MKTNLTNSKRILSLVLTLVMVLSCLPGTALPVFAVESTSGTCGENLNWEFDESTGTLSITGTGAMTDYEAPWYEIRADITKVVIGDGATSIGGMAFSSCSELASIELPNSVTTIGEGAFSHCYALASIELPNSVTTIGNRAFRMCESIVSISLPDNLTSLGVGVFRQCTSLVEITVGPNNPYFSTEGGVLFNKDKTTLIKYPEAKENNSYAIPSTVTTIAEYAFNEANNLVAVAIPSSVTTIADYAFYYCEGLLEMTVPDSVTSLGSYSFAFCGKLETLRFGTGITEIPDNVASGCESLITVELPDTIKKIGDEAFVGTKKLENCIIPDGVTDIGDEVFDGSGLLTIVFPRSLQSVGARVVTRSSMVERIHYCGTEKEWNSKVTVDEDNEELFSMFEAVTYLVDADYDNYCDICGRNYAPAFKIEDNKLYISYDGKTTWEEIGNVADGKSVESIVKTDTNGNVDTYTITYSDDSTSTFTVTNGKDGITPQFKVENSILYVSYDEGQTWTSLGSLKGDKGDQGEQGEQGEKGDTGNGIAKIEKTSFDGLVDTYTITYTNGDTAIFTVTNGAQGEQGEQGIQGIQGEPGKDGHTPIITIQNGNWYIDGVDTGVAATGIKGDTGNGIASIRKTGFDGLVDIYTITYTDGTTTTFTVTNGKNGEQGEQGEQGIQGIQGVPGKDGHTPVITIVDGYWYIDGVNTNILAVGINGADGKDGITPQLRINSDNIWEVSYDNGATWESLGISAVGQNGSNGTNGVTPKLRVNSKNIWEVSYDNGATWESLGISAVGTNGTNGANGKDGADGKDGEDGQDGVDGKDGKDGVDGKDGITPKLRINDENIWEVSYDGGQTWESLGVAATGADGITPQLRINGDTNMWEVSYDNGATWTSMGVVATGADGKDGGSILPIIISCISLAGMVVMFCIMMADRKKKAFVGK